MVEPELGSIENVNPRDVWPNEASDFTPWLAEHIDSLGEALGMDIEVTQTEAAVGAFSLDLLGKESGSDRVVIVENQLDRTDHGHLGQLLAYAAGLDAKIVVWISPEVRDEHREAVHWLNELSDAVAFFAVELEVLRIDDSAPALRFNVVEQPSDFQRELAKKTRRELSDKEKAYQAFYADFVAELDKTLPDFFTTRPEFYAGNWLYARTRHKGFSIQTWFDAQSRLKVVLRIEMPEQPLNTAAFLRLRDERETIEAQIGERLTWDEQPQNKSALVFASRSGGIESSAEVLEDQRKWAVDLLPRFSDVFNARIAALDLDALAATTEEAAP